MDETGRSRKDFTKVSLEREAAQQLNHLSMQLTGETGRRISMSAAILMLIENYRENQSFLGQFGMQQHVTTE